MSTTQELLVLQWNSCFGTTFNKNDALYIVGFIFIYLDYKCSRCRVSSAITVWVCNSYCSVVRIKFYLFNLGWTASGFIDSYKENTFLLKF